MNFENTLKQFYYKKSRIQQYKGFCYTFQLGTTKKAGDKMGITPSAITMQIKSLEDDLGIKLFERTDNHRLIPTQEGKLLYAKLIILIQNLDGVLEEFLIDINKEKLKNINIGAHYTAITTILPSAIKKHFNEFSNTNLNLFDLPKQEAIKKLINNELDFILYPFEKNEIIPIELDYISIFDFKLVIIANRKHPMSKLPKQEIKLNEIKNYQFFHISNYMISDMYKSFINKYNNKININLDKGNWDIAKNIVKANICLSCVGNFYINENDKKEIIFKHCPDLFSDSHYVILIKKGNSLNPTIENLINIIKNYKL
jgi:DNA-binding transcriptional LysR family regulator